MVISSTKNIIKNNLSPVFHQQPQTFQKDIKSLCSFGREIESNEFPTLFIHLTIVFTVRIDRFAGELFIEIGIICIWRKNRYERSLNCFRKKSIPIYLLEPRMWFYLSCSSSSDSFHGIFLQKQANKTLQFGRNFGYFNRLVKNILEERHTIAILKGWISSQHLVHNTPKAPPINSFSMSLFFDYLRSEILRSSTDSHC